jgi:EpsI family protein
MPDRKPPSPYEFLRGKAVLAVSALLAVEILVFYSIPTSEYIPTPPPLDQFASQVGQWAMVRQTPIDDYTQNLLKADDTLTRDYVGPGSVQLFVAFFKSQRAGVTPHSPKVCLPGNGWTEEASRVISVHVPGENASIPVNRYIVKKDEQRQLVLYWYQNPHRVTASEYLSKFYLIYDALRYRRSDEALVRVITGINGDTDSRAEENALQFIRAFYQPLKEQMWAIRSSAARMPFSAGRLP